MQTLEIVEVAANVAAARAAAENAQNEAVYEEFSPVEIPLRAAENEVVDEELNPVEIPLRAAENAQNDNTPYIPKSACFCTPAIIGTLGAGIIQMKLPHLELP